jgi:hypothetical protein
VLVDGDHSADGVRIDIENVLASPACARTIVLVHDTMNEEVRTGLNAMDLPAHPTVVYVELNFVPGYRFATGVFAGQYFGGLGLVITGDCRLDGYGNYPVQDATSPPLTSCTAPIHDHY